MFFLFCFSSGKVFGCAFAFGFVFVLFSELVLFLIGWLNIWFGFCVSYDLFVKCIDFCLALWNGPTFRGVDGVFVLNVCS